MNVITVVCKHPPRSMDVVNEPRHDICCNRCDWRSRKFFVDCINFSVNNANCEQNLPKPTHIAYILRSLFSKFLQSGASSRAKTGGAYFSDVTGSIQDPIAVPGPCEVT